MNPRSPVRQDLLAAFDMARLGIDAPALFLEAVMGHLGSEDAEAARDIRRRALDLGDRLALLRSRASSLDLSHADHLEHLVQKARERLPFLSVNSSHVLDASRKARRSPLAVAFERAFPHCRTTIHADLPIAEIHEDGTPILAFRIPQEIHQEHMNWIGGGEFQPQAFLLVPAMASMIEQHSGKLPDKSEDPLASMDDPNEAADLYINEIRIIMDPLRHLREEAEQTATTGWPQEDLRELAQSLLDASHGIRLLAARADRFSKPPHL